MSMYCDSCNRLIFDLTKIREDEFGELICKICDDNKAEAAYDRQQERDLESPPETSKEEQIRTWREHQEAHKR